MCPKKVAQPPSALLTPACTETSVKAGGKAPVLRNILFRMHPGNAGAHRRLVGRHTQAPRRGDEEVEEAVIVDVAEGGGKVGGRWHDAGDRKDVDEAGDPEGTGQVVEEAGGAVPGAHHAAVAGQEEILAAVVVDVTGDDARAAGAEVRKARQAGDVTEGAVAVVDEKGVRLGLAVGQEEVEVTVLLEVEPGGTAEPVSVEGHALVDEAAEQSRGVLEGDLRYGQMATCPETGAEIRVATSRPRSSRPVGRRRSDSCIRVPSRGVVRPRREEHHGFSAAAKTAPQPARPNLVPCAECPHSPMRKNRPRQIGARGEPVFRLRVHCLTCDRGVSRTQPYRRRAREALFSARSSSG